MTPVDLLVIGPHPDDIEIGFAGAVAAHTVTGFRVGLCDLTRGELGSNGTPPEREAEAQAAAEVLGASWRVNLGWPDGGIRGTDEQIGAIVQLVRQTRPAAIALPYWNDRHPDHRASSEVVSAAVFKSALRRFRPELGDAWRHDWVCYYFINDSIEPSFVLDVSDVYDLKRRALDCHESQFTTTDPGSVATRLTAPAFRQLIESRDAQFGARVGVAFAEGVVVREPLLRPHVMKRWSEAPFGKDRT
jgi:bacillithiol biosynthesis deacetylase BshB1